jgi:hypothetical protein
MALFISAYNTTALAGMNLNAITRGLENADGMPGCANILIGDSIDSFLVHVLYPHAMTATLPAFDHPMVLPAKTNKNGATHRVFLDMRQNIIVRGEHECSFRSTPSYTFGLMRAALTHLWANRDVRLLNNPAALAMRSFATVLSDIVTNQYSLSELERQQIKIICAIYYLCCFTNDTHFSPERYQQYALQIGRVLLTSSEVSLEMVQKTGHISDIGDLCDKIKSITGSVRLTNFNWGVLFNMLRGTWFGHKANELVCSSLEHIPTWLTMVHAGVHDQGFRAYPISKTIQKLDKREEGVILDQAIMGMLGGASSWKKASSLDNFNARLLG